MNMIKFNSISFITRLLLACVLLLLHFSVKAKIAETTYTYDVNSNRISETVTVDGTQNKNLTYEYDSNNRLTEITDNLDASQNISYTYDNNGNRTSKTQATNTSSYIYNAEDQLVRVEENSNTLASFAYDHQGMRIKKEGERGSEIYTYDDQSVLYQTDNNGALQAKFTYGPNQLLSITEPNNQQQYYLFDGLGSPITLTKANGEITARYSYDAFGNKIQNTGNSANRFTFTGHEEDRETDLVYMKARYYDPDTGQFLSEDNFGGFPDKPPSLNKYLYAYNNPGIYVDPDGNVAIVGAGINMGLDLAIQGVEFALSDEEAFTLDKESLLISAASGAAGVGLVSNVSKLSKLGKLAKSSKVLSKAAKNTKVQNAARGAAAFGVDASVTAADMAARGEEVTTGDVVKSTLFGMAIGKQIDKVIGGVGKRKGTLVQESDSGVGVKVDGSQRADFYVRSDGQAIPGTGYRATGGKTNIDEISETGKISSRDPTYITFEKIKGSTGEEVQDLLQLPRKPSHVAEFDTKQILDDVRIPDGRRNTSGIPEPITETYPDLGKGGGSQAITNKDIYVDKFEELPK